MAVPTPKRALEGPKTSPGPAERGYASLSAGGDGRDLYTDV
jgi:hypothetical protein